MSNNPEKTVFVKPPQKKIDSVLLGILAYLQGSEEKERALRKKAANIPLPGQPDPLQIRFGIPGRTY